MNEDKIIELLEAVREADKKYINAKYNGVNFDYSEVTIWDGELQYLYLKFGDNYVKECNFIS